MPSPGQAEVGSSRAFSRRSDIRGLIVTFDFSTTAGGSSDLERWRELVTTESIPRFEELAGLRHKLFFWRDDPPEAVTVYLFADDEAFAAYAKPVLADPGRFATTQRFGAKARIELLNVAGIADGPAAPG